MKSPSWSEVNQRLDLYLNDDEFKTETGETFTRTYPERQRLLAWLDAQRVLVWHTPRQRSAQAIVDTGGRSLILPDDFLAIRRIYDADLQQWLVRNDRQVEGGIRYDDDDLNSYWIWGNRLYLDKKVTVGTEDLTLYYWAYWPEVEYTMSTEDGSITVLSGDLVLPPWAILPLCHLTAANCLMPGAIQAAEIRNWGIKVDSGTPIQNVRAQQAKEHWWWWNQLLAAVPRPAGWGDE